MKISATPSSHQFLYSFLLVALLSALAAGCKAEECKTLVDCCEASMDIEGIGASCGSLTEGVKDPQKCRTIIKTIHYVYEDRGKEVPPICQLD